jgi:hypothetical protein
VAIRLTHVGTQADPLDTWDSPDTGRRMEMEIRARYSRSSGGCRGGSRSSFVGCRTPIRREEQSMAGWRGAP